jgi:proton-dependent oligopeptide transporter, POT family
MAIATTAAHAPVVTRTVDDAAFFGHPRGLSTLFFTEMWERFSYYGMRGFLVLYMTASVADGGMGLAASTATGVVGTYAALVYLMSVPGGWVADRITGQRRAVFYGGVLIAAGHFSLAVPTTTMFYAGLVLIVLGTGLLKPNISVIVGQLYDAKDVRRDAGFSIFYMGINMGAFFGPIITGFLAQNAGFRAQVTAWGMDPNMTWHFAFGAAGVGMTLGLLQYVLTGRNLGQAGQQPGGAATPEIAARNRSQALIWGAVGAVVIGGYILWQNTGGRVLDPGHVSELVGYSLLLITVVFFARLFLDRSFTSAERGRLGVIFVFFACAALFWSVFEQAATTLNLFANEKTENVLLGFNFPSSWFQSLNALFIFAFAPLFALMWVRLGKSQPASPTKFALGLIGVGLGFLVLVPAAGIAATGTLVSPLWLTILYLIHTFAELCLSPVGLSSMTKLAPARVVGSMMGIWFLGASVGNFLAGQMGSLYGSMDDAQLFGTVSILPVVAGVVMILFRKPLTRMMGGVD